MDRALNAFVGRFPDEDACYSYLFEQRWPYGFRCPRCGCQECYPIRKRSHYQCKDCRYQASLTAGTIFHHSHISLRKWFLAIHLVSTAQWQISPIRLQQQVGVSYPTAWLMFNKIQDAMNAREHEFSLFGRIQLDNGFFGTNARHGGSSKKGR